MFLLVHKIMEFTAEGMFNWVPSHDLSSSQVMSRWGRRQKQAEWRWNTRQHSVVISGTGMKRTSKELMAFITRLWM